jgi:hypothetical protein
MKAAANWREQEHRRRKFLAELLTAPQGDGVGIELHRRLQNLFFAYHRAGRQAHMVFDLFQLFVYFLDYDIALTLFGMCNGKRARKLRKQALVDLFVTRTRYRGEKEAGFIRKVIELDGRSRNGTIVGPKPNMTEATMRRYLDEAIKDVRKRGGDTEWLGTLEKKKKKKA